MIRPENRNGAVTPPTIRRASPGPMGGGSSASAGTDRTGGDFRSVVTGGPSRDPAEHFGDLHPAGGPGGEEAPGRGRDPADGRPPPQGGVGHHEFAEEPDR